MFKTTIQVEGMACSMCENHVQEAIRRLGSVSKVKADRKKKEVSFLSEEIQKEIFVFLSMIKDWRGILQSFRSRKYPDQYDLDHSFEYHLKIEDLLLLGGKNGVLYNLPFHLNHCFEPRG